MKKISYSKKIFYEYWGILVIIIFFLIFIFSILPAYWTIRSFFYISRNQKIAVIIELLILTYLLYYKYWSSYSKILDKIIDPFFQIVDRTVIINIRKGKLGFKGEGAVEQKLDNILSDNYFIVTNFKIPGKNFDIDFLVIGPKGLVLFEVKNLSARQSLTSDKHYYFDKENTKKRSIWKDPRDQAQKSSIELEKYLEEKGFKDIKIRKAVVYASDCDLNISYGEKSKHGVFVIQGVERIENYFTGLYSDKKFTPEFCAELKKIFIN